MFTGIITGVGRIAAVHDLGSSSSHGKRLSIAVPDGYLDDVGIAYCGRYGDWAYIWTDESFMSGERAAESVLSAAGNGRVRK